jgi:hypothetical protein
LIESELAEIEDMREKYYNIIINILTSTSSPYRKRDAEQEEERIMQRKKYKRTIGGKFLGKEQVGIVRIRHWAREWLRGTNER